MLADFSGVKILRDCIEVQEKKRKSSCVLVLHQALSHCSHALMTKKCTKKCDAHAELLFCQSKPIAFLRFSLMSLPSLLKVTRPSFFGGGTILL